MKNQKVGFAVLALLLVAVIVTGMYVVKLRQNAQVVYVPATPQASPITNANTMPENGLTPLLSQNYTPPVATNDTQIHASEQQAADIAYQYQTQKSFNQSLPIDTADYLIIYDVNSYQITI